MLTADAREAARRAVDEARASLGGLPPALAVLFASAHFFGSAEDLAAAVAEQAGPVPLIGCVAEAVAGGPREVESEPAVSLWLAAGLGPVETYAMEFVRTSSGGTFGGYRFDVEPGGVHLMLCDPFTFPAGDLLAHLNDHVPGTVVMGGMASGGLRLRQSRLFLDGRVLAEGAVGAHLPEAEVHPLVAQGCRPVGDPYTTTRAEGNVIFELGGRPPVVRLLELAAALAGRRAAGALLFTCNGRGSRMFAEPDHDAGLVAAVLGEIPVAGLFCAGELGPVGGRNFLHTFTASIALFPGAIG